MTTDGFREIEGVRLPSLLISLGLGVDDFVNVEGSPTSATFSSAMSGGVLFPGKTIFLQKDKLFLFDNELGSWSRGDWPKPIADVFGIAGVGIDACSWVGPRYPDLWFFFVNNQYIAWKAKPESGGAIERPIQTLAKDWGNTFGTWFGESGCNAAIHDERIDLASRFHVFNGANYLRHDFDKGAYDIGPTTIAEAWPGLEEPWTSGIDLAFWGRGDDVGSIFFVAGQNCAVYAPDRARVVRSGPVETVVKGWAEQRRPQLFLHEEYVLNRYVGGIEPGPFIRADVVEARSADSRTQVIAAQYLTKTSETSSVLDSSNTAVVSDLAENVRENSQDTGSRDTYQYAMDADFHGDASAKGIWGGEVNAHLGVKGGSDDLRTAFARSVDKGISQQVQRSSATVNTAQTQQGAETQKAGQSEETSTHETGSVDKDTTIVTDYYQIMQSYLTILALEHVGVVYVDQHGSDVAELSDLERLLDAHVAESSRQMVRDYICAELSAVADVNGQPRNVLRATGKAVAFDGTIRTTVSVPLPDGTEQTVTVAGVAKTEEKQIIGTTQMRPWTLIS
ncbi:hypothetical protein ACLMAL_23770 [Nocardia sp. CWNU-33]|uniref:hypothetical protein n=1 Tax=Nocardia sp. CWNU-33 TaxID=3392117 RepID=UPI00398EAED6